MIDFTSKLGARARARLAEDFCIWLTTVDGQGVPQPRPVWFIWDEDAVLIYSMPETKKLEHLARHPDVALNFDGGPKGEDVVVVLGRAAIAPEAPPAAQVPAYVAKYAAEIGVIGYTVEQFSAAYSVAIRVRPTRLRQ